MLDLSSDCTCAGLIRVVFTLTVWSGSQASPGAGMRRVRPDAAGGLALPGGLAVPSWHTSLQKSLFVWVTSAMGIAVSLSLTCDNEMSPPFVTLMSSWKSWVPVLTASQGTVVAAENGGPVTLSETCDTETPLSATTPAPQAKPVLRSCFLTFSLSDWHAMQWQCRQLVMGRLCRRHVSSQHCRWHVPVQYYHPNIAVLQWHCHRQVTQRHCHWHVTLWHCLGLVSLQHSYI